MPSVAAASPRRSLASPASTSKKKASSASNSSARTLKRLTSAKARLEPSIPTEEDLAVRAAELILSADFLLIAGGAGFSADSGLPVYKDIADVPAYRRMDVSYSDLCVPEWLRKDPEIFYGFWGSCFNDYMNTEPHKGYSIIKKWADTLCSEDAALADSLRPPPLERRNSAREQASAKIQRLAVTGPTPASNSRPSTAGGLISRPETPQRSALGTREGFRDRWRASVQTKKRKMFVYTSNVDTAFERAGIRAESIYEIHGNVVSWQCGAPCCDKTWRLPASHRFEVCKASMRAPQTSAVVLPSTATATPTASASMSASSSSSSSSAVAAPPQAAAPHPHAAAASPDVHPSSSSQLPPTNPAPPSSSSSLSSSSAAAARPQEEAGGEETSRRGGGGAGGAGAGAETGKGGEILEGGGLHLPTKELIAKLGRIAIEGEKKGAGAGGGEEVLPSGTG